MSLESKLSGLSNIQKLATLERIKKRCVLWHNEEALKRTPKQLDTWRDSVFLPKMKKVLSAVESARTAVGEDTSTDTLISLDEI